MKRYINIIAFNIPYPPNYGGIIDVYYKLKALHACGVRIILHCFLYERPQSIELESICEEIYYYPRKTGWLANLSLLPYNVYSRKQPDLIENLLKNDYPILFEGLHTCYYLPNIKLKNRIKIFRECNIEHNYYFHLAKAENNLLKKSFFFIEAFRFRLYQQTVNDANLMVAVSTTDTEYLQQKFREKRIEFMPCFHSNDKITAQPGTGNFILYHGKLSVQENEKAALYLITHVFSKIKHTCVIAGMNPSKRLQKVASLYPNIKIEANPSNERMESLIHEAHIHMLITFQGTGLKLKLLNSLFAGRHTIVNKRMLAGSGLDPICHIADSPEEMIHSCNLLMLQPLESSQIELRKKYLFPAFSNQEQGKRLYKMIYDEN